MPVNRILVGGANPVPDRPNYNLVAGAGISITASDDVTNGVSKATIALGAETGANNIDFSGSTGTFATPTGANTLSGNTTLAAGKSLTPSATGGIAPSVAGFKTFWTGGVGIALATAGNDTACSNGDIYWASVFVPCNTTLTGISYLIGSVGGTTKAIVALYSSAGALLASSALAGTTVGTAANFQALDFTGTYAAVGPALYYVALQFDGTTAKFRTHTAPGQKFVVGTVAGTFGTLAAITPGTTYAINTGPLAQTY